MDFGTCGKSAYLVAGEWRFQAWTTSCTCSGNMGLAPTTAMETNPPLRNWIVDGVAPEAC
jgi:hypothetical protein